MRDPRPFVVHRDGVYLFTIHAYSEQQARALVAARLSDLAGVTLSAPRKGSPVYRDLYR